MKKIFFSVIIILLATLNLSAEILEIEKNGYKLLYNTDKESYSFEINGVDWPLYAQKDNVSGVRLKGTNRVRAQSIFSLVVIDTSLDKRIALNSKVADSVSYERFDDTKLCITYSFDEGITVPVVLTIDEEGLHISIDTLSIKEEAPVYVFEIALLPCFSSSSLLDEGFFLIPDGEGARLRFNSGRSGTYNEPIYGQDQTVSSDVKLTNKETIRLPLFGVSRNGNALIAVIENSSAAIARVVASSSSSSNPYNSCYFNFILRSSIEESISDDAFQVKYEEDRVFNGTISILIRETEDNLVSMAETFSDLFISASEYRLEEDFIIHWNVAESENIKLFGIPLPLKKSISTLKYDDVHKMIEALSEYGRVHLNLENWNSDEIFLRHVDSLSFISSAGSDKDRKELLKSAWGGVSLSVTTNYEKSNSKRIVKDLSQRPAKIYDYLPASSYIDKDTKRYLVRPDMLDLSAFLASTETIAFNGITEVVYSDYNEKRPLSRADYIEIIKDKLSAFSSYFVYGGNYYSLENASHVFDVSTSSGFNCLSESVPFYQMVLSGKITYSYGALNTSASPTDEILRVLSTGAVPSFELRSESDKDGIEEILSEYMEDFRKVSGRKITSYLIISDAVRETVFDDGTTVRVDYQNGSYTVNGGEL